MEPAGGHSKCRTLPPVPAVHTRTVVLTTGNDDSRENTVALGRPRKEGPHGGHEPRNSCPGKEDRDDRKDLPEGFSGRGPSGGEEGSSLPSVARGSCGVNVTGRPRGTHTRPDKFQRRSDTGTASRISGRRDSKVRTAAVAIVRAMSGKGQR